MPKIGRCYSRRYLDQKSTSGKLTKRRNKKKTGVAWPIECKEVHNKMMKEVWMKEGKQMP